MRIRALLAGVLCLLMPVAAVAAPEPPAFQAYGVADGLPSNSLTGLALDRAGYLWIATRDGLARFDGVGYTVYRHVPGPGGHASGQLRADSVRRQPRPVWVGIEGKGLCMLDRRRGVFSQISQASHPLLKSDDVWAVAETPDRQIWFGTFGGGLYRLDLDGTWRGSCRRPAAPTPCLRKNVLALAVDARGACGSGRPPGFARWNGQGFEPCRAALSGEVFQPVAGARRVVGRHQSMAWTSAMADVRIEQPAWRDALPEAGVDVGACATATARTGSARGAASRSNATRPWVLCDRRMAGDRMVYMSLEDNEGGAVVREQRSAGLRLPPTGSASRFRGARERRSRFARAGARQRAGARLAASGSRRPGRRARSALRRATRRIGLPELRGTPIRAPGGARDRDGAVGGHAKA
jgi:hypothetical protein